MALNATTDLAEFVSDYVNSVDPPYKASEVAELYVDQHWEGEADETDINLALLQIAKQAEYYLP